MKQDLVEPSDMPVAVIGAGYMGGGIALVLAAAGHPVTLADVDGQTAEATRSKVIELSHRLGEDQLLGNEAVSAVETNLHAAPDMETAVESAAYVTEAVPEQLDVKTAVLTRICKVLDEGAVIGSNTSAIPIKVLSAAVTNPARFLGVHWYNPAPLIPGVEIIAGPQTEESAIVLAETILGQAGKETARVTDSPGFVANRLQFALYSEACRMVEEGVVDAAQLDTVVRNTFGFRLALFGPFAIADMAGLDVYAGAFKTMTEAYGERFAPPSALTAAVAAGNIGVKNGRGILDIADEDISDLLAYRDHAYRRLSQLRAELGQAPGL